MQARLQFWKTRFFCDSYYSFAAMTMGLVMLGLLLAACRPEHKNPPSILDRNETIAAINADRIVAATASASPVPNVLPTATSTPPRPIVSVPTATGTPPIDRTAYVRQTYKPGPWKTSFFTAIDGTRLTLKDFDGRVVVVQIMSSLCQPCQDQAGDLRLAAQALDEFGNAENVVFISLSVDALDTLDNLAQFQTDFGMESTPTITWITGQASQDLIRDIRDTFGERYIDPTSGQIFFVDLYGYGQISDDGFIVTNRLRDVIINLGMSEVGATEEATEGS